MSEIIKLGVDSVVPISTVQLRDLIGNQELHKKLSDAIIEMITSYNLPYYGEFMQFVNCWEAKIGTCGVNVTDKGMNFYWDREWIDKRDRKEVIFTIIHEVFHLLFDHQKRGVGYDKKLANLAADAIINSTIHSDLIIGESLSKMIAIPKDEYGNNSVIFMPKEYKGPMIFEEVYHWMLKEYTKWSNENSHKMNKDSGGSIQVDKNGNATYKPNCPSCGSPMDKKDEGQGNQPQDNKQDGSGGQEDKQGQPQNGQGQDQDNQNQQGDGQDGDGQPQNQQGDGQGQNQQGDGQDGDGEGQPQNQQGEGNQGGGNNTYKCPNCGQEHEQQPQDGQGQGNGQGEQSDPTEGYGNNGKSGDKGENDVEMYPVEKFFENIENNQGQSFDIHFDDEVPEQVKREWVESTMEKLKNRGLQSGEVEKIINKLRKSEKDYLKEIKRKLSNDIFGNKKNKSITKPNRRGIWGLKGNRKYKNRINAILDTSGSMGGEFEKVLSYIFQNDIEINLIQCDAEIQGVEEIKCKKDLEKMKIRGLGGTTLTPGLQYIASDKNLNKYNTVILTDGYTDSLDFTGVNGNTLILSTSVECPIVPGTTKKIKQIIIDK